MKIKAIHVYQVDLPLTKPYWLSGGRLKFEKLDSTIVGIETDSGLIGWGEGCPWGSTYLPAFGLGIRAGIAELAPSLIGQNPLHLKQFNYIMDKALPGHLYVKSALDMACWDLVGKQSGRPLYALLGGKYQDDVPLHSSISTDTPRRHGRECARVSPARLQNPLGQSGWLRCGHRHRAYQRPARRLPCGGCDYV